MKRDGSEKRACLVEALAVLADRVGVCHDSATYVHVGSILLYQQRSDDHREIEPTTQVEIAERAGVHRAPHRLDAVEDAHGRDLRRSRHRSGWKGGADEIDGVAVAAKPSRDGRHHLEHGRVALDRHQLGHRHAADLADPTEVVAHEIDDHQVLGAVLRRARELLLSFP